MGILPRAGDKIGEWYNGKPVGSISGMFVYYRCRIGNRGIQKIRDGAYPLRMVGLILRVMLPEAQYREILQM